MSDWLVCTVCWMFVIVPSLAACSSFTLDLLLINSCDVIGQICKSMLMQPFEAFVLAKLATDLPLILLNRQASERK